MFLLLHHCGQVWVLNWVLCGVLLHLFQLQSLTSYRDVGCKLGIKIWIDYAVFHFFFLDHSHILLFLSTSLGFVLAYFLVGILNWNYIILTFFRVILIGFCHNIPILFEISNKTIKSNFFLIVWRRIFTWWWDVSNYFCSNINWLSIQTSELLCSWVTLFLLLLRRLKLTNVLRW